MKMAAMAAQLVPSPPSLESQGTRGTGNFSRRWKGPGLNLLSIEGFHQDQ